MKRNHTGVGGVRGLCRCGVSSPAAQVHREGLVCLLAARTASESQLFPLRQFTVLIRGDYVGALRAMRKGSFRSPTLQDIAMRFQLIMRTQGGALVRIGSPCVGSGRLLHRPSPRRRRGMGPGL